MFRNFPPDDLLDTLVNVYFAEVNNTSPLLHEPTFRRGLEDGLHYRCGGFGGTVLLVCAIASRFMHDLRGGGVSHPQSAGWDWFAEVERTRRLPIAPAQIYDLQIYAVRGLIEILDMVRMMPLTADVHIRPSLTGSASDLDFGWRWHPYRHRRGHTSQENVQFHVKIRRRIVEESILVSHLPDSPSSLCVRSFTSTSQGSSPCGVVICICVGSCFFLA